MHIECVMLSLHEENCYFPFGRKGWKIFKWDIRAAKEGNYFSEIFGQQRTENI